MTKENSPCRAHATPGDPLGVSLPVGWAEHSTTVSHPVFCGVPRRLKGCGQGGSTRPPSDDTGSAHKGRGDRMRPLSTLLSRGVTSKVSWLPDVRLQ
jgi:hypothetical protein